MRCLICSIYATKMLLNMFQYVQPMCYSRNSIYATEMLLIMLKKVLLKRRSYNMFRICE